MQAATIKPVRLLGRAGQFGAIAKGKAADPSAVKGDPLVDIDPGAGGDQERDTGLCGRRAVR